MTDTTKQPQAASDDDLIRRGDVLEIQMLGVTVTRIERAIRAIPKHDPLSDQRVVALVEAMEWIEDYALAFPDLELIMEKARAALRAIGSEA